MTKTASNRTPGLIALHVMLTTLLALLLTTAAPAGAQGAAEAEPVADAEPSLRLHCAPAPDGARLISCRWSAGPQETRGYILHRASRISGGVAEEIARTGLDQQGFRDDDVRPGVRYTYLVQAVNDDGRQVAHSNRETTGIPLMVLRCRPTEVDGAANAIGCRWSSGPELTRSYAVLRWDPRSDRVTRVAHVGTDVQGIIDDSVQQGVRYTYLVRALDHEGHLLTHTNRATTGIPVG